MTISKDSKIKKPLTGKYGHLQVLYIDPDDHRYWVCVCERPKADGTPCGKQKSVLRTSLVSGNTRSCGCMRAIGAEVARELVKAQNRKQKYMKFKDQYGPALAPLALSVQQRITINPDRTATYQGKTHGPFPTPTELYLHMAEVMVNTIPRIDHAD